MRLIKELRNEIIKIGVMIRKIVKKFFAAIQYHLKEKWKFVYFELSLDGPLFSLPALDEPLLIRIAQKEDITRIESDVYPYLTPNEENDRRYISKIGGKTFQCFIAEKNDKIVHYFLLFEDAGNSPLIKTPFDKAKIFNHDAYLGSAFTVPEARGLWIVPQTLLKIIEYLKNNTSAQRVLVLVHRGTPGAVAFYQRLGFKIINDAYSKRLMALLLLWKNQKN